MDPLSVLKDFNTANNLQSVKQVGGNVLFGDRYQFPASTPVYKAAGAQAATTYYSLQDVLFYLKNRLLKPQDYIMSANQAGVGNINILDRKKLLDVLDGLVAADPALVPVGVVSAAQAGRDAAEPQAKRPRLEDEGAGGRGGPELQAHERQLRNRNTMLLAPNKDFRKVLEVVSNVKKLVHKAAAGGPPAGGAAAAAGAAGARGGSQRPGSQPDPRAPAGSSGRYTRDTTADQLKAMVPGAAGGLAINMYGTSGKAAPPPPPPSSQGTGYVPVRKGSAAQGQPPAAAPPSSSQRPSGGKPGSQPNSKAAAGAGGGKGEAKKGGVPIIIVPSGMTSMINMYNARAFLEEGRYMTAQQAMAAAGGAPKPASATFRRTAHRSAPVEYSVTDRPPPPSSPDWDRVVAVVVQGAKWQFKDWPHKGAKDGDLRELLMKVAGFYVHYADEKVVAPVSDWAVTTVPLHREKRHQDMTAMLGLYRQLDTFLQSKRSTLAY